MQNATVLYIGLCLTRGASSERSENLAEGERQSHVSFVKKTNKTMTLAKETIRNLQQLHLERVRGGDVEGSLNCTEKTHSLCVAFGCV